MNDLNHLWRVANKRSDVAEDRLAGMAAQRDQAKRDSAEKSRQVADLERRLAAKEEALKVAKEKLTGAKKMLQDGLLSTPIRLIEEVVAAIEGKETE